MIIFRNLNVFETSSITFNRMPIERVDIQVAGYMAFRRLDIRQRDIYTGYQAFLKFRRVFDCSDFDLGLRLRFINCYVRSVLFIVWNFVPFTFTINRLVVFEMAIPQNHKDNLNSKNDK